MNNIETVLLENIDKPNVLFVFPTDIAVSRWVDHLLCLRKGTIAMEKFTAWDTFKKNSIRSRMHEKKSIPSVLRKMFVASLIRENADHCSNGEPPVFTSLIRKEWAQQADSFTGWITDTLPQLALWYRQTFGTTIPSAPELHPPSLSGDDLDLYNLTCRYAQFLENHNLFEPAWETPPFEDTGRECFIFFSESLFDFGEYRELLESSNHVKIIQTETARIQPPDVFFYTNSRSEIAAAALYISALVANQKAAGWDSISVSIPEDENYGPCLLREFENRNIPYIIRSGKPLASYPAGQFFRALAGCAESSAGASSNFSFSELTALLINRHLPWKDGWVINDLTRFGIDNNCISSWIEQDDGKEKKINVWEDSFSAPFRGFRPETAQFFRDLKQRVNAICKAPSFEEIRKQYFIFREKFFNMDEILPETNTILSRCICGLMELVEIEKSYPGVKVPNPFNFFTGYLEEVVYLAQQPGSGVTILPYRTAAPAPFDCHVILGASQDNLSRIFSPLAFLSRYKREKLGIIDNDTTQAFINLHRHNSRLPAAFFCSEKTFKNYAIPCSMLNAPSEPVQRFNVHDDIQFDDDRYRNESRLFASLHSPAAENIPTLNAIHQVQKQGFEQWRLRRNYPSCGNAEDSGSGHLGSAVAPVNELIRRKFCRDETNPGKFSVSSTSLALYFQCPLKWLFERVIGLEYTEIATGLMADNITGIVYHAVIELFLKEIISSGGMIPAPHAADSNPVMPEAFRQMLAEKIEIVFNAFPCLPGNPKTQMSMLTARFLLAEKSTFRKKLEILLTKFISCFSGYRVLASESEYTLPYDTYCLHGRVDCILEKGTAVIVDFKTKSEIKISDYAEDRELADFQLPLYLRLAEDAVKKEVHTALYFSIADASPQVLFGVVQDAASGDTVPKKADKVITRESGIFANIMNQLDDKAKKFAAEIAACAFPFRPADPQTCPSCRYRKVCRTLYRIHQGKNYGQ